MIRLDKLTPRERFTICIPKEHQPRRADKSIYNIIKYRYAMEKIYFIYFYSKGFYNVPSLCKKNLLFQKQ